LTGSENNHLYVYNLTKTKPDMKIGGFAGVVAAADFSKKTDAFVCCSYDGSFKVFNK
jgi:hypothetical protein